MNIQDAISKVRKLLALSKSQNINEAALAASKAAAIMQEYCIEEAALHTPDSSSEEPVNSYIFETDRKASISDVSGYHSGLRAGHKVNIGGQAKAGLNAPARMFKKDTTP